MKPALMHLRIAYISDQQFPIEKADSEQVVNTVSALRSAGLDIELVIPRRWRSLTKSAAERRRSLSEFYKLKNGLATRELLHLPLTPLRLEKYSHGLLAPAYARLKRYDIVYTRNPFPAFLANQLGITVIFETYRVYRRSAWLNRLIQFKHLLGVITHSQPSRESLTRAGLDPAKVAVIHNGFNPALFEAEVSRAAARQRLGLNDDRIACYAGRLDREKGVESLLELARQTPELTFLLIGRTQKDPADWIARQIKKDGIENIRHLDWVPADQLPLYLYASDILLIPPASAPLTQSGKTVLPMKLFSYLAAERPILAPRLPDMQDILTDENAILIRPDDIAAAAAAIHHILKYPQLATRLAARARLDAMNLTWEARAKRIVEFLNERLMAQGKQTADG